MKLVWILILMISASSAYAGSCGSWQDQIITFEASIGRLEPKVALIREGDKVCIRLRSLDNSYSVLLQGSPLWLKANKKTSDEGVYYARKTGQFTLKCAACGANATLEVLPVTSYDEKAKKYYEEDSVRRRQNGSK